MAKTKVKKDKKPKKTEVVSTLGDETGGGNGVGGDKGGDGPGKGGGGG